MSEVEDKILIHDLTQHGPHAHPELEELRARADAAEAALAEHLRDGHAAPESEEARIEEEREEEAAEVEAETEAEPERIEAAEEEVADQPPAASHFLLRRVGGE